MGKMSCCSQCCLIEGRRIMSIYRDKSGNCWISSCRFKDANGTPKRTTKRGFGTKEEAEEWERRLKSEANIKTLTLSEFFRVYARDIKPTVAASTWENKAVLFRDKIEPYLGATFIEELSSQDILLWQDLMRSMRRKGWLSLFTDLSQSDKQSARCAPESCGQLLSTRAKPHERAAQDG